MIPSCRSHNEDIRSCCLHIIVQLTRSRQNRYVVARVSDLTQTPSTNAEASLQGFETWPTSHGLPFDWLLPRVPP